MPELIFAQIDAKESFHVITLSGVDYPRSEHNVKIMFMAIVEYLRELQNLQKRIKKQFEPKLIDDSGITFDCTFCGTHCPCNERYCEAAESYDDLYYT